MIDSLKIAIQSAKRLLTGNYLDNLDKDKTVVGLIGYILIHSGWRFREDLKRFYIIDKDKQVLHKLLSIECLWKGELYEAIEKFYPTQVQFYHSHNINKAVEYHQNIMKIDLLSINNFYNHNQIQSLIEAYEVNIIPTIERAQRKLIHDLNFDINSLHKNR